MLEQVPVHASLASITHQISYIKQKPSKSLVKKNKQKTIFLSSQKTYQNATQELKTSTIFKENFWM